MLWFAKFPEAGNSDSSKSKDSASYFSTLKLPVTWIISLAFTGPLALYLVFNTWLPIYYQEIMGISKAQTMQWMSWLNLGGIPAALATGFLLQAFKKCKVFIISAAVLLPLFSFMAISSDNHSILPVMLILTGVGMFLSVSPLITLLQSQPDMNPGLLGMIMGTMFSVTYILSAMAPGLIGYFYDSGFNLQILLSISCFIGLSPAIALFLSEK